MFEKHTDSSVENKMNWNSLMLCLKVYPELDAKVKNLIEKRLGYLPTAPSTIKVEPELRIIYQQYRFGQITLDELYKQSEVMIKFIRYMDISPDHKLYDYKNVYDEYAAVFLPYMLKARKRIKFILGYDPPLEYSLAAEIWLSQVFAKDDTMLLPDTITPTDYRVMTSIKYREVFLQEGEAAAMHSPLLAMNPID